MDRARKFCLTLSCSKKIDIDEMMLPFTGICAVKLYVPGKPSPEGLKHIVLTAPSGLMLDFEVYKGKDTVFLCERTKEPWCWWYCSNKVHRDSSQKSTFFKYIFYFNFIHRASKKKIYCI